MKKSSAKKKCLKESTDKTKKKLSFENVEEIKNKIPIPESYPKSPSPISEINPPKETNEQKLEKIFKEGDKVSKYDFDLHKHLKENIKFKDKQCKDGLSTETLYCLQCKLSTCSKCPNFNIHKDHPLVKKSPYYICEENLINEHFDDINLIIELNPEFLNTKKVKEELKNLVNTTQL